MTITEIARLAGVSSTTVSKIINHKAENISAATKQKVLALIEEYNYVPYQKAVDYVSQQSNLIALLLSDVSDIFCSELLRGAEDYFFARQFNVIACSTDNDPEKERRYLYILQKQNVRGIIHFPMWDGNEKSLQKLEHSHIFNVILDDYKRAPNALKAYFNNKEGGRLAVRHLLELGHERIGYLAPKNDLPYLAERLAGYRQALEEERIRPEESLICRLEENDRFRCGYKGTKYLLAQQATAIFCCDDHVARGAYRAILESGLRIPGDISVVGFDDAFFCEVLEPNLTSIKQSAYDIGCGSAQLLFAKLSGQPLDESSIQIEPQLMIRRSTAPPGAGRRQAARYLVLGEIRADIVLRVDRSLPGQVQEASAMSVRPGGWAAEQASRLLADGFSVYLAGYLGNDEYGRKIYDDLTARGINTDGVLFDRQVPTGLAFGAEGAAGQTPKIAYKGANNTLGRYPSEDMERLLEKTDICLADDLERDSESGSALTDICRRKNVRLIWREEYQKQVGSLRPKKGNAE